MRLALLAFVAGIWLLQQQASLPSSDWAMVLLPLCTVTFALRRNLQYFGILLILSLMTGGFLWAAVVAQFRIADALPSEWESRDIDIIGVVAELPKPQERGQRFSLDVEQVLTPIATVPKHISLASYSTSLGRNDVEPTQIFHPGERWQLTVRLKRPHGSYNPYGFDFEVWALERNLRATGYVKKNAGMRRLDAFVWRPAYLIERCREHIRERFISVLGGKPYEGVLRALAIGDESGISRADWQVFLRTGVNHLMSISGLHVTMVSGVLYALIFSIWRRMPRLICVCPAHKAAALAGMGMALTYALLTGFSVPTQRTVYMLSVVAWALWTGRNIAFSLVLCWALFVTTMLDPWAVLAPGFWLSFGAVAVMVYAAGTRLGRSHWLLEAARVQWAVTLGLIPLLLALFQQVSLISPIANAFAIPVISLVVVPLTLLGAVLPMDGLLLLAHFVMSLCMDMLSLMSSLPAAVWQQHAPQAWTVVLALIGVLWLLLPRGIPVRWLGAPLMLPIFLITPKSPNAGEMSVAVLDVGQGLAVVVQTAQHAFLFDAGPRFSQDSDSGSWVILPFLRGNGVSKLDGMVVSHDDIDHYGGASSVLAGVPVRWFLSSLPQEQPLLSVAPEPLRCVFGQRWEWDNVKFEVLHPTQESYANGDIKDNDRGCVVKVTSRYGSILLPADIERDAELEVVSRVGAELKTDILVAPHHGGKTASIAEFVQQVNPKIVVFTMGYRNRFGHPRPEVVKRYEQQGSKIYRTDIHGAVLFDFAVDGIATSAWRQTRLRYWLAETGDAS